MADGQLLTGANMATLIAYYMNAGDYYRIAAVTAGASTVTLDRDPENLTKGGFLILDPSTANCEVRPVTGISSRTITLQTAIPGVLDTVELEFIATGKKIRIRKALTNITGNGTTITVTTATNHNYVTGNQVEIQGTTNWNGLATIASTPNGTTFTITSAYDPADETAGWVQLDAVNGALNSLFVGQTIQIAGSSSNNGVFTVASMTNDGGEIVVNETVVNENTGAACSITDKIGAHSAETVAIYVKSFPQGLLPLTLCGVFPNAVEDLTQAANNRKAFNRLNRYAFYGNLSGLSGVQVPSGYWFVDDMLRPESGTATVGGAGGVRSTLLKAASTFPFDSTGDIALFAPVRNGLPCRFTMDGGTGRWYLDDLIFDGNSLANSNGVLYSSQQPAWIKALFVQNCVGKYGVFMGVTQQVNWEYYQALGCNIPLRLGSAALFYLQSYNPEQTLVGGHSILIEGQRERTLGSVAPAGAGGGYQINIEDIHLEENIAQSGDVLILVDSNVTTELNLGGMEVSTSDTGVVIIHFASTTAGSTYSLRNCYHVTGTAGVIFVKDDYYGLNLDARSYFNRRIGLFMVGIEGNQGASPNAPEGAYEINIPGVNDRMTRIGFGGNAVAGVNAASNVRLHCAATETALSVFDSAAATVSVFNVIGSGAVQSLYQRWGSGSPNGVVSAPLGAIYHNTAGGANTSVYFKESGSTGNTGWVAK